MTRYAPQEEAINIFGSAIWLLGNAAVKKAKNIKKQRLRV
jgi:hypothetical protein